MNPKFVKSVVVDFFFEEVQPVVIKVFDIDKPSKDWSSQDFIGQVVCVGRDVYRADDW